MLLVTRSQWGARDPTNITPLEPAVLKGIVLHYSAMQQDEQVDHANCAQRVRNMQAYHMDHNRWADIAYNFVCCKHGYVFEGRGWGVRCAANGTAESNDNNHAVVFLGDDTVNLDDVTRPGRRGLIQILVQGFELYPKATLLRPHSQFTATACPGDQLRAWMTKLSAAL